MLSELTKVCSKCQGVKPLDAFYKNVTRCKKCVCVTVKKRRDNLKNDPVWVESERVRAKNKYYRLGYNVPQKDKVIAKPIIEYVQAYNKRNPEKIKARNAFASTMRTNKWQIGFGMNNHHWSYNEEHWLDVIELTVREHHKLHRFLEYDKETFFYKIKECGTILDTKDKHIKFIDKCLNTSSRNIIAQSQDTHALSVEKRTF